MALSVYNIVVYCFIHCFLKFSILDLLIRWWLWCDGGGGVWGYVLFIISIYYFLSSFKIFDFDVQGEGKALILISW